MIFQSNKHQAFQSNKQTTLQFDFSMQTVISFNGDVVMVVVAVGNGCRQKRPKLNPPWFKWR